MKENKTYGVVIECITYNHNLYISKCLDGFCMQKTTFPFVCVIIDDDSTDGEKEYLHEFAKSNLSLNENNARIENTSDYELIFARHKDNINCFFAILLLKYNHYSRKISKEQYYVEWKQNSKYIAVCEGDDYWTDSQKLKIQYDFLESHPSHSSCIHAYVCETYTKDGIKREEIHKYPHDVESIPIRDVFNGKGMFGATASFFYRRAAVDDYPEWAKTAVVGDRPLKMVLYSKGEIGYINKVMCVYQKGTVGSWTTRMRLDKRMKKTNRVGLLKINRDFDKWTKRKYHSFIKKSEREYKLSCIKEDAKQIIRSILIFFNLKF